MRKLATFRQFPLFAPTYPHNTTNNIPAHGLLLIPTTKRRHCKYMKNPLLPTTAEPFTQFLLKNRFVIPRHQRPYAWEEKHVKWLLDDIAYGDENKKPYHYLGHIILAAADQRGVLIINDGQQRIITLALICAYLCKNFAGKQGKPSSQENQAMRILFNLPDIPNQKMKTASQQTPRITLSPSNHLIYAPLISSGQVSQENVPINTAWKTIDKFFKGKPMAFKISFFDFICSNLYISWTKLRNKNEAIASFVTQNATGKQLEQVQLTCAHLLRCLNNDKQSKDMYEWFEHIRTKLKSERKFFDYTRCFAQCKYGALSNNDFCFDISKKIKTSDVAYDFVRRLSDNNRIERFERLNQRSQDPSYYTGLMNDGGHSNSLRKITDYLQDLGKYKSVSNAILFALLSKYFDNLNSPKKNEIAKFVCQSSKLLSSFFQRATHSFDRPFAPSRYESQAAGLANAITKGSCKTSKEFLFILEEQFDPKKEIIPNAPYEERMKSISFPNSDDKLKRILMAINQHMAGKSLIVPEKTSVEHILPKSSDHLKQWSFNKIEHGIYKYRLGNLTLLSPDENSSEKPFNASFSAKYDTFKKSGYAITKDVIKNLPKGTDWSKETIAKRQAELANIASQVWNLNPNHNKKP